MSFAKLNVWVRTVQCEVVNWAGHLHVYNCHGALVLPITWFTNGHIEVQVPPGCYMVQAGIARPGPNVYTDRAMVIVRCGEEACVNLVLPAFSIPIPPIQPPIPLVLHTCAAAIMMPLFQGAGAAGIKSQELNAAVDVIARAARIDKQTLLTDVKGEIALLEENLQKFEPKQQEEVRKLLSSVKDLHGAIAR